ncbi:PAS domain S-box protein [Thermodesulfobacteriota bacterium]
MISRKPTYEALEQSVTELQKEITERKQVEEALRESEATLRSIFRAAPTGIGMVRDRVIAQANERLREMIGYSREELLGKSARILYPTDEDFEYVGREKYGQIRDRGTGSVETRWQRKDGEIIDVLLSSTPIDPGDLSIGVTFTALDITRRKQSEEALRESEELLKKSQEIAHVGSWRLDLRKNDLYWSDEVYRIFGLPPQGFGATYEAFLQAVHPDDRDRVDRAYKDAVKNHQPYEITHRVLRPDGSVRIVHEKSENIVDESGKTILSIGMVHDITERVQVEAALRESEIKYSTLVENSKDGIIMISDNVLSFVNSASIELVSYPPEEMIGADFLNFVATDYRELVLQRYIDRVEGKYVPSIYEIDLLRKDGTTIPVELNAIRIDFGGKPADLVFIRDITKRKQSQEALRKSEKRYRFLADNVKDVIWTRDMDLNLTYISPSVFEQQGLTVDEAMARAPEESWTPESFKQNVEMLKEELEIEKSDPKDMSRSRTIEAEVRCKDGSTIWTEAKTSFLRNLNGEPIGIIGVTRDITKRKQVEEALQQSEERYRSLVENTMYGYFVHSLPSGRFLFLNQRVCDLYGYTMQEGLELTVWDALSSEDHERIKKRVQARLEGQKLGPDIQTYTAVRKNGTTFRAEVSSSLIIFQDRPAVQGIFRDVTEQERLEQQLHQAQKMEAMGTLAGGIAHDFNNLLMGIQGRTSLMLTDPDIFPSHFEHLKGIEDYVKSAADLTRQLLGFARGGRYEVKATDLNALIRNENRMFGRTRKEIHIHEKFEENLWTVEIDRRQIEQMLLNIYINAWQAMPGGGNLYIQTENSAIDQDYIKPFQIDPGNYVKISITDTGVGMDAATRQRIFDPFFTTKEMGRGTGLGLASAYGIIKNHHGFINVYSETGEGTTFNIYLPASEKEAVKEEDLSEEASRGTETILLVDDEEMIIEVGREFIEKLGYNVLTAKGGKEAIKIYKKNRGQIDMVVLDMIMPEMGGGDTYDKLKEIHPDIKVLLSSGYSINGQASEILDRGCSGFIQKPFNLVELSKKIRSILDKE